MDKFVLLVSCQLGSGNRYLEITEGDWDGKTPWYTGSCK